jgi:two-component system, OmpR family, phosphate regulon sensor histidine kinase PhoR
VEWIVSLMLGAFAVGVYIRLRREQFAQRLNGLELARYKHKTNQLEQSLAYREAFCQAETDLSTDAMVELDTRQRIVRVNNVAQSIFGEPPPDISLIAWTRHHQLAEVVGQAIDNRLAITHQFDYEGQVYQIRAAPVEADNQLIGAVLILKDVTELQRLGRARRDLVANISHDLRTPITGIHLVAETLLKGALTKKKRAQSLVEKILAEADVLAQINRELMDLSLIESGRMPLKLVPLNLAKLVQKEAERLKDYAERKNLKLVITIPPEISILADQAMLSRVLTNLLHNAIKFTGRGEVTIGVTTASSADLVCLMITDTGIGIAPADQARIFERFYRGDSDARSRGSDAGAQKPRTGTGLGLAIAKHVVEAHGGEIWVKSVPGQGTTFYFTLPAAGEADRQVQVEEL